MLSLEVQDTGVTVSIDENPVARYAFFCEQYNLSYNKCDNTMFEVHNVQTRGYRLYRFAHEWCQHFGLGLLGRISCDSYCGPCDCLGRLLVGFISLLVAILCAPFSVMFFFMSSGDRHDDTSLNLARVSLSITFGCLLIPLCLLTYAVCYLKSFFVLVRRNFARVPRSRVLSNMVWVPGNHITNKHL